MASTAAAPPLGMPWEVAGAEALGVSFSTFRFTLAFLLSVVAGMMFRLIESPRGGSRLPSPLLSASPVQMAHTCSSSREAHAAHAVMRSRKPCAPYMAFHVVQMTVRLIAPARVRLPVLPRSHAEIRVLHAVGGVCTCMSGLVHGDAGNTSGMCAAASQESWKKPPLWACRAYLAVTSYRAASLGCSGFHSLP